MAVSRGEDTQADRRCHRVVQWPKGVRRNTSEQGPGLRAAKPLGKGGCRQHGGRTKPGQRQGMMGHPQQGTHDVLGQRIEVGRCLTEQAPPPGAVGALHPVGGGLDRAVQHAGAAAVERVDAVDLREAPGQAVSIEAQPRQELRADGHRVDRRAVVVQQAGDDRLAGAGAAADVVG